VRARARARGPAVVRPPRSLCTGAAGMRGAQGRQRALPHAPGAGAQHGAGSSASRDVALKCAGHEKRAGPALPVAARPATSWAPPIPSESRARRLNLNSSGRVLFE
jgi:hypothetical protein